MNGATKPPEAASTWSGTSRPVSPARRRAHRRSPRPARSFRRTSSRGSRPRRSCSRRTARPPLGAEVVALALHRHQPRLHVPVAAELLPAHLDVDAHHQVGPVGGLAGGLHPLAPAPLQRQPGQHRRLARAGRRAARRACSWSGRVPQLARGSARTGPRSRPSAGTRPCRSCSCRPCRPSAVPAIDGIQVVTNVARFSRACPSSSSSADDRLVGRRRGRCRASGTLGGPAIAGRARWWCEVGSAHLSCVLRARRTLAALLT